MGQSPKILALRAAFPTTIPILCAFSLLGLGSGLYATSLGLPIWLPVIMAAFIYTGTLEFIIASMLVAPFNPGLVFVVSLLVSARHIFYAITMIDRYRNQGLKGIYLIYAMCDETFSLNAGTPVPAGIDSGWYYFFVTLLNQLYWLFGVLMGSIFGRVLPINTQGVEFVMCAMFTVIFVERILSEKNHVASCIGIIASALSLAILGPDSFLIAALLGMLATLTLLRPHLAPLVAKDPANSQVSEASHE